MLVRMRRVDVVAPRSAGSAVVRAIHRLGVVHLVPFDPPPEGAPGLFGVGGPGRETGHADVRRLEAAATRVAEIAGLLALPAAPERLVRTLWELPEESLLAGVTALEPVERRAAELTAARVRLEGEADRLAGYRRLIEALADAVGHLPSIRGYGSTGIVVQARFRPVVGLIREELESLTDGRCEVIAADLPPDRVAAVLLYPVRLAGEVRALLGGRDLEEVSLPASLVDVPFDELVPRLGAEEAATRRRIDETAAAIGAIARAEGPLVAALGPVLADRVAEARVLDEAGSSDHLVAVGGWVPAGRLDALRDSLAGEVGPAALVLVRAEERTERTAPVALANRGVTRAFEPLASFVMLPRYGTLDPTPVVALAFPIFVGLMVGDVGYGLVLLGLLAAARLRWPGHPAMRIFWPVGALAALSTIAFGVLFGELFGDAGSRILGMSPILFDRREEPVLLLQLAVSIGLAQIVLGLVLGIANATRLRERREAIARTALLASLLAAVVVVGYAAGAVPTPAGSAAAAVLVGALVVLTATLGLAGPLEVMGAIGNVLSYARLMAIGLASVMLALVANRLGGLFENVVLGVLVAATFHALNFGLGFFDSSVQGLRLQYVEFFSKFVEPGGIRYEPFVSVLSPGATA